MRRIVLFLIAVSLVWLASARAESPVLTISSNNTPMDRLALQELSREALRRLGYELNLVNLPSERSLVAANAGEVDGEGLRVPGLQQQYPNLIQIPERFIGISFVAFAKDKNIKLEQGWDSLQPYSVAFITGWKMFEANAGGARVVNKVDKPEQLFLMLDNDRVDLALYTRADGIALARKLGLPQVAPLVPALKDVDMFLYLNKKHAALAPKIAQALRDMKADGSYQRILAGIGGQ